MLTTQSAGVQSLSATTNFADALIVCTNVQGMRAVAVHHCAGYTRRPMTAAEWLHHSRWIHRRLLGDPDLSMNFPFLDLSPGFHYT